LLLAAIALLALKVRLGQRRRLHHVPHVDNFIHGYGLRWNNGRARAGLHQSAVDVAMSALTLVTPDVYFTSIALGIVVTLAACALLAFRAANGFAGACVALLMLASSKAFIDFRDLGAREPAVALGADRGLRSVHGARRVAQAFALVAARGVGGPRDGASTSVAVAPLLVVQLCAREPRDAPRASARFAPLVTRRAP